MVEFPKAEELKLLAKVEDGGEGACAGYVSASPGQKYYPPGAEVMVTATAHPGYVLVGWEGEGEAWVADGHSHGDPYSGSSDPLEEITEDEIFLKMGYATEESSVRQVTAVFGPEAGALVVEGGGTGWFSGSHAPPVLEQINIPTIVLNTPSVENVKEQLSDHRIFVFNGHGSSGICMIDDPNEISFSHFDAQEELSGSHVQYDLLFLNCCSSTASQTSGWLNAFNCDVLVGWDDTVGGNTAEAFDYLFWEAIAVPGTSVTSAVNQSWNSTYVQFRRITEGEPGKPEIIGNGGLILNPCK